MAIQVRFFGQFREMASCDEIRLEAGGRSLLDLIEDVAQARPTLRAHLLEEDGTLTPKSLAFINGRNSRAIDKGNPILRDGDRVVLIPAVVGGASSGRSV